MSWLSATVLLVLVMDPLGGLPLFVTALRPVPRERHQRVLVRELLIALAIMVVFLLLGQRILDVLHVTEPALTAAGGVILFLIALRMIFPSPERPLVEPVHVEPFIVPLAIPYTAGPSVLATEILLVSQDPSRLLVWLGALVLAWSVSAAILMAAGPLQRRLGSRTLTAVERLMGMILIITAVQMLLAGVKAFFAAA